VIVAELIRKLEAHLASISPHGRHALHVRRLIAKLQKEQPEADAQPEPEAGQL
jgi:hypothetical protein